MSAPAGEEVDDLVVDSAGVCEGELGLARVRVVLSLLRHREWAWDGDLDRVARVRTQELHVANLYRMLALDGTDDARHRIRVAAAVERRSRIVDVDAGQGRREAVRIALPTRLAVGDDVQSGPLLVADREQRRVVLGLLEVAPGRPARALSHACVAGNALVGALDRSASRAGHTTRRGSWGSRPARARRPRCGRYTVPFTRGSLSAAAWSAWDRVTNGSRGICCSPICAEVEPWTRSSMAVLRRSRTMRQLSSLDDERFRDT